MSLAICEGLCLVLERGDREHGPEDLLLEDPHLVVALQDGRLEVVAARRARRPSCGALAADQAARRPRRGRSSRSDSIFSSCCAETCAPIIVARSSGLPCLIARDALEAARP